MKTKEAQSKAVAEHGELALISVDGPKNETNERISLRPPMLQVICNFMIYRLQSTFVSHAFIQL